MCVFKFMERSEFIIFMYVFIFLCLFILRVYNIIWFIIVYVIRVIGKCYEI